MVSQWDTGTRIQVEMGESVETATSRKIIFRKPAGGIVEVLAAVGDPATTLRYTTVDGDLDVPGQWRVEGWAQFADGSWHSGVATLIVDRVIQRTV